MGCFVDGLGLFVEDTGHGGETIFVRNLFLGSRGRACGYVTRSVSAFCFLFVKRVHYHNAVFDLRFLSKVAKTCRKSISLKVSPMGGTPNQEKSNKICTDDTGTGKVIWLRLSSC